MKQRVAATASIGHRTQDTSHDQQHTRSDHVNLAAEDVAQETKQQLTDDGANDGSGRHPRLDVGRVHVLAVLLHEHDVDDVHDEEVVGIVEEAEASHEILVHGWQSLRRLGSSGRRPANCGMSSSSDATCRGGDSVVVQDRSPRSGAERGHPSQGL
ncbi:unnamed protein product [Phytophthora lilii]|uniref:Unnamed protein product n=1 Tax=Phytophthora lilii TaxID=2077276 RepID=A0A9W7CW06_9STRA|nr:unnamed protein product [Phytophthora lilii]